MSVVTLVLVMYLVDHVEHCDIPAGEGVAGCFAFLGFVACVLSVVVCLLFFFPVNILHKYIAGCYRPVRVADGPKRPTVDL